MQFSDCVVRHEEYKGNICRHIYTVHTVLYINHMGQPKDWLISTARHIFQEILRNASLLRFFIHKILVPCCPQRNKEAVFACLGFSKTAIWCQLRKHNNISTVLYSIVYTVYCSQKLPPKCGTILDSCPLQFTLMILEYRFTPWSHI